MVCRRASATLKKKEALKPINPPTTTTAHNTNGKPVFHRIKSRAASPDQFVVSSQGFSMQKFLAFGSRLKRDQYGLEAVHALNPT